MIHLMSKRFRVTQLSMPLVSDVSNVIVNSERDSKICTKNVTRFGSRRNDCSSYMLEVTDVDAMCKSIR